MGFNSGNEVFDPVCAELQHEFLIPQTRKKILIVLIRALQDLDWDTEDESLEEFRDDPVVVEAFAECNIGAD